MTPSPTDRLDSWKDIAAYLNRSVRTARRWEADEGLPVHRHVHQALGSVYAFKSEIDAWRQSDRRRTAPQFPPRAVAASTIGAVKAVAVLPFVNLSPDAENEYLADALTDEVIADLSRIRALRVISRTSSMVLKGTSKDARTIGRQLDVRYLVEGSVRRDGSRLRLNAQLIDAHADAHLWSDVHDGVVDDLFAIQERLARRIVEALELELSADEDRRLAARPILNVHAYECYLQARQEAFRWRRDAIDHAVQLLRNGLALVGDNAELYAALGRTWLYYREAGIDVGEGPLREAEICARKVFTLDPQSASGMVLRGWIRYSSGDVQGAVHDLKSALATDPNNPDTLALLSNCYLISGRVADARPLIDRLVAADPLTPLTRCMPGWADLAEGRFAQGLEPYRQMLEMDPGNPMARLFYAEALALNGRVSDVRALARTFPPQVRHSVPARLAQFLANALAGMRRDALASLSPEIEDLANTTDVFPRFLAQGYALAGVPERALHWLGVAVDRGFINYPFLAIHDPLLEGLRGDARFRGLMAKVRERWQKFQP